MKTPEQRSVDPASIEMLKNLADQDISLAWDRLEAMQPQCGFGQLGLCCRNCAMGPCRIDPVGDGPKEGVCGASADVIAARNLGRMIASGSAAHCDHGRDIAHTLLSMSQGKANDFKVNDEIKLRALAEELDVETEGKELLEIARGVAEICMAQFSKQEGETVMAARAPAGTQEAWRKAGVMPRGMDREVVEMMHRTHIGVDNDSTNLMLHAMRTALADGWGGSMIATDLTDVLFRSPSWTRARANLGVLDEKKVNIIVHGHEPSLSEMIVAVTQEPKMIELAKSKGADGINLSGMCCTANEILVRHGIDVAGSFLQQELALATGAIEAMVVDVQCVFPALGKLSQCFHTKLISTSSKAKFPFAQHVEFEESRAMEIARQIVGMAIENFPNRDKQRVQIPTGAEMSSPMVAGFSAENTAQMLGGRYRPSYRPLNNAIIEGRLRGVAAVVGCNNPKQTQDSGHLAVTRELIANDVLVASTGCTAVANAKAGLLCPQASVDHAGQGLQEVCRAVGMPPVLHLGSCVDNSRILMVLSNMVAEGGLGETIADLPAGASAPEWMSEKAISIAFYAAGSGAYTVLGQHFPVQGAPGVMKFLTEDIEGYFGGKFAFERDPIKAAHLILDHIDRKRAALKLADLMYEVPYAPRTQAEAVTA